MKKLLLSATAALILSAGSAMAQPILPPVTPNPLGTITLPNVMGGSLACAAYQGLSAATGCSLNVYFGGGVNYTAAGTSAATGQGVQGMTGGVPVPVTGTASSCTSGFLQALGAASGCSENIYIGGAFAGVGLSAFGSAGTPFTQGTSTEDANTMKVHISNGTGDPGNVQLALDTTGHALGNVYANSSTNGAQDGTVDLHPNVSPNDAIAPSSCAAAACKTSAANLYGYDLTENASSAGYFAFLNATYPTSGASIAPLACLQAGAGASLRARMDIPDRYATALSIVSTSSCTTYTPVAAQVISANFE